MKTANAEAIKETITIERVGPYGVKVGETWYGLNKPLEPSDFENGKTYEILKKEGQTKNGPKSYIAQILGVGPREVGTSNVPSPVAAPLPAAFVEAIQRGASVSGPTNDWGKPVSDYALAKDGRISRAGIWQAVIQSPAIYGYADSYEGYMALVQKTYEAGLKIVQAEG